MYSQIGTRRKTRNFQKTSTIAEQEKKMEESEEKKTLRWS
jgi:hypothetical protein